MMDVTGKRTLEIMNMASHYNQWLFSLISSYLDGEILEVGAGIGNFTEKLVKDYEVTALDYSKGYIRELQKKGYRAGFGDIEKGKYFFKGKKFKTIICMNVLEHIRDDRKALKNMSRLLGKGGRLILLVPALESAYGEMDKGLGHFRRYSKRKLIKKIQDSGFKIQEVRYLNWLGLIGWFVNSKILGRKIIPESQVILFDKIVPFVLSWEKFLETPFGLSILVIARK